MFPSIKITFPPNPPTDPTTPPSLFPSLLDPCLACDGGGPRPGPPLPLPLPPALDNHDLGLRREVARIPRPLPHAQVSAAAVATSQTVVDEAGRHDATLQTPPDKNCAASLWVLADVVLGFDSLDPYLEGHCLQPLSAEG